MTTCVGLVGPLPPPYGGMANQANQLYQLLKEEKGLHVHFLQTNPPYSNKLIGRIKGIRALFRLISYVFKIIKLSKNVDVIHVFSNSGWSWQLFSAPVIWVAWLNKTPVIINYRGGEAKTYFDNSISWVTPSMNKATEIVVPSGYLKQVFSTFGFNAQEIPNIINLERFKPVQNKAIAKKSPHLIITRNLEAIYGISTAIEAVALIQNSIPNFKLSIAGSGPQKKELQALVQNLKLDNNITFTGKLTPAEIANLYQEADIMLNPTTVDNMPNSILEAMASCVAVISTNVGGIPYIVKDNKTALLIDPGNAKAMADKIIMLLNNKLLYTQLINNGLETVQKYAWPHVRKQWLNLYHSLGGKP